METTPHAATPPTPRERGTKTARTHDLDTLSRLDGRRLGEIYASGSVPSSLAALEGDARGRMLAVRGLDRAPAADAVRRLAGWTAFPWEGKSFAGRGETGTGANRVRLFGRHRLFPFVTRVQPSKIDGKPCVALDYDLPDNPPAVRSVHDEIREVEPGLFLGPAMRKARGGGGGSGGGGGAKVALWFALDLRGAGA